MFFKSKAMKKVISENTKLAKEITENEYELTTLTKQKRIIQDELDGLKSKRKIEEEDLKHLIKMREERLEIEFQKKEIELERKHQDNLKTASDEYRNKSEEFLKDKAKGMEDMYSELLKRLPDINVRLKGDV